MREEEKVEIKSEEVGSLEDALGQEPSPEPVKSKKKPAKTETASPMFSKGKYYQELFRGGK